MSDPLIALKTLQESCPNQPEKWIALKQYIEIEEAKRLRDALSHEVGNGSPGRKHKM